MTEGEEGRLDEAERADRALRSIALFVEGTRILSLSHDAQQALSLPPFLCRDKHFGEEANRRSTFDRQQRSARRRIPASQHARSIPMSDNAGATNAPHHRAAGVDVDLKKALATAAPVHAMVRRLVDRRNINLQRVGWSIPPFGITDGQQSIGFTIQAASLCLDFIGCSDEGVDFSSKVKVRNTISNAAVVISAPGTVMISP